MIQLLMRAKPSLVGATSPPTIGEQGETGVEETRDPGTSETPPVPAGPPADCKPRTPVDGGAGPATPPRRSEANDDRTVPPGGILEREPSDPSAASSSVSILAPSPRAHAPSLSLGRVAGSLNTLASRPATPSSTLLPSMKSQWPPGPGPPLCLRYIIGFRPSVPQ